jgi:DNA topoisomerase-2
MNRIKVKFDKELKMISVYNNGKGIPIEIHKMSNVYVPEMLFGQLMTSSNYNSRKKFRGIGAKITNLFSTQFTVETTDTTQKKRYIQTFHKEYTKVSFIPDLERFRMTELTDDAIALLSKRVYDMAGIVIIIILFMNKMINH